jgi:Flp pilus assembly protein TadD
LSGETVPLDLFDTLAAVHAANGDFNQAVEIQQRVVSLLPEEDRAANTGY